MTLELLDSSSKTERFALKLSLFGSLGAFILAVVFTMLTRSGAILLDGFYSLVTLSMSLLTLKVAGLLLKGRSRQYQFGYYGFEPLINTIKGIIVLSVTLFALVSAIESLLHGGRPLEVGNALIFALISTAVCFSMALILRTFAQRLESPLLAVDARDWLVDAFISGAIAIAFGFAFFLSQTDRTALLPYVDPTLVSCIAIAVIPIPIRTVIEGVNQLLAGAPDPALEDSIRQSLNEVAEDFAEDYPIQQLQLQMAQIGRALCVSIQILVPAQFRVGHVQELDQIRAQFTDAIEAVHPYTDIDMCFTGDEQWLKDESPA